MSISTLSRLRSHKGVIVVRQKIRRVTEIVALFSLGLFGTVVFQNCGSYEPAYNPLYEQTVASECIGYSCGTDAGAIELTVANGPRVLVIHPYYNPHAAGSTGCTSSTCFDVAGNCETAGYPGSVFYAELQGPTGIPLTKLNTSCDSYGRYSFRVILPSNFNHGTVSNNTITDNITHKLVVTLKGVDAQGREVDNPTGLNKKSIEVGVQLLPTPAPTATP